VRDSPLPVIAAVNGPVVGVGASLVLVCDVILASSTAYFLLPFADIGLVPDGGATALLAAAVGRNRALAASLLPERMSADDAHRLGIVHRVVEPDSLAADAAALAERFAAGAGAALAATKAAINASTLAHLDDALERELAAQRHLLETADFAEAVAAFAEKRPPRFGH
jgi:enoyl-CoA hydratase